MPLLKNTTKSKLSTDRILLSRKLKDKNYILLFILLCMIVLVYFVTIVKLSRHPELVSTLFQIS